MASAVSMVERILRARSVRVRGSYVGSAGSHRSEIDIPRMLRGVARWRSQQTLVDSLLALVAIGIYIPRQA
jgi:hypothetical protein